MDLVDLRLNLIPVGLGCHIFESDPLSVATHFSFRVLQGNIQVVKIGLLMLHLQSFELLSCLFELLNLCLLTLIGRAVACGAVPATLDRLNLDRRNFFLVAAISGYVGLFLPADLLVEFLCLVHQPLQVVESVLHIGVLVDSTRHCLQLRLDKPAQNPLDHDLVVHVVHLGQDVLHVVRCDHLLRLVFGLSRLSIGRVGAGRRGSALELHIRLLWWV